jgi:iduronate 2-sulfatase
MKNRILIFVLIFLLSLQVNASSKDRKYNILFIAVDDLRSSELSCYGTPIVKTPYIDHLASEGILFNHAYVQLPQCMPSRASILTGFSTEKFNIYDRLKVNDVLESAPNALSLTKFFEKHGYLTKGFGKVYHYESDAIKQFSE